MHCPVCDYDLQKLTVTTTSGGNFDVDHCGRCGGTWFDPYEINRIPYHEVVRLAGITVLPKKRMAQRKVLHCPRDGKAMDNYYGEAVPAGVRLFWCKKCLGIWASQKALEEFKNHQEGKINEFKEKEQAFPALSVVFIPAMLTAFLLIFTFVTVLSLQQATQNRIMAKELVSTQKINQLSPSSVSITFNTTKPVKSWISYGLSRFDMKTLPIAVNFSYRHAIILTELFKDRSYIYNLVLEDQEEKRITTELGALRSAN